MRNTSITVETIDNSHRAWSDVLAYIFRTGNQHTLLLREDGWLSSRQMVLAAFDGDQVAGHLCFRIEPVRTIKGKTVVQAKLDSFSVERGFDEQQIENLLLQLADSHSKRMQCTPPRMQLAAC